jgi:hypothetical protein
MVPQEPSVSLHKTVHSVMFAFRSLIMGLQEPSVLCNETMLSVAFGLRNHMMVPQDPSLLIDSFTNLNTSAIVLSQDPYHGSSGSISFDKRFHKFEHFCMPPRAPFIILNKARGGTRNLHPEAHPALFSIIRGGGGVHATLAASAPSVPGVPGAPGAPGAPSAPGFASTAAATAVPGAHGAPGAPSVPCP